MASTLPLVTDRETRTHRRGRSQRSYGHCRPTCGSDVRRSGLPVRVAPGRRGLSRPLPTMDPQCRAGSSPSTRGGAPSRRRPSRAAARSRSAPESRGQPLRRPRAPRAAAALGPAAGARRRARVLGAAEGGAAGPEGEPARRPHRGPPAGVPRLRGRDPEGRVRRGEDRDLGPRHLRGREGPRRRADPHLRWGAREGEVRPLPDQGRQLDDPSHGPAARPRAGADAAPAEADARHPLDQPAARRGRLGLRDQVGRRPRDRLQRGRPPAAREPHPPRDHLALPGAAGHRPRARRPPTRSSTARWSPSTTTASPASSCSRAA